MRKHITITAGSSALLLALTGCGPSEEEEFNEQMEEVADEMSQAAPDAGIEDSDVWVGEGEMPPQYVGISEGMTSVDRTYTGRMAGEVEAEIGEPVAIDQSPFTEVGDYVGTMTLDQVETIDSCDTGNGQYTAEDGRQLVQAWFTLDTTDSGETFDFSGPHFKAPDDSATNAEEASINSDYELWMCQNQPGQPEDVEPGQEVERVLFFNLPSPDSPITYTSGLFDVTWGDDETTVNDTPTSGNGGEAPADHVEHDELYEGEEVQDLLESCIPLADEWETIWNDLEAAEPGSVNHEELAQRMNDLDAELEEAGCWG